MTTMPLRLALRLSLALSLFAAGSAIAGDPPAEAPQTVPAPPVPPAPPAPPPVDAPAAPGFEKPTAGTQTFLNAWTTVRDEFYDPAMHGVDWEAVRDELLPKARAADTPATIAAVINEALDRLHASHTRFYHPGQREYYEIADVFARRGGRGNEFRTLGTTYTGAGMVTTVVDGKTFAADVYDGGPADQAGILVGDELISVDGQPWADVDPWRGHRGDAILVITQRTPDPASRQRVHVEARRIQPFELFLAAQKRSARVIERDGRQVAYIRVRSYANEAYHEALKDALSTTLAKADALVLDLRGGWGGATPEYMDLYSPFTPAVEFKDRRGQGGTNFTGWRKPVVMLVDHGTRSGKEILAFAFKKAKIGRIVGERTAGAVLGGRLFALNDGAAVLVAVSAVKVDGEVLEGVGVEPDVTVARPIPYCAGADPQLDAAVREAAGMVR